MRITRYLIFWIFHKYCRWQPTDGNNPAWHLKADQSTAIESRWVFLCKFMFHSNNNILYFTLNISKQYWVVSHLIIMTGRNKLNGPIPNIFGEAPVDYHIKIYRKFDRIITKLGIACLRKIYESPHAFGEYYPCVSCWS